MSQGNVHQARPQSRQRWTPDIEVTKEVEPEGGKSDGSGPHPRTGSLCRQVAPSAVGQVKQDGKNKVQCEGVSQVSQKQ